MGADNRSGVTSGEGGGERGKWAKGLNCVVMDGS